MMAGPAVRTPYMKRTAQDREHRKPLHHAPHPQRSGREPREAFDQARAIVTAEEKESEIPQRPAHRAHQHDDWKREVAAMRGEAREDQQRLTLEQRPYKSGGVTVMLDEGGVIHASG
jgi:hypothetical protein